MSRRRAAIKKEILPDHKFKDKILTKFMNRVMLDGKKSVSENIVYNALNIVLEKTNKKPIEYFHSALVNNGLRSIRKKSYEI